MVRVTSHGFRPSTREISSTTAATHRRPSGKPLNSLHVAHRTHGSIHLTHPRWTQLTTHRHVSHGPHVTPTTTTIHTHHVWHAMYPIIHPTFISTIPIHHATSAATLILTTTTATTAVFVLTAT
ncbi:hypothetical protein HanRHA438_Chr12g0539311 [Helianthus annuus]|nr:hypothetical protein HanRHA438_Chr12g0539311 [Helianthus annuus]